MTSTIQPRHVAPLLPEATIRDLEARNATLLRDLLASQRERQRLQGEVDAARERELAARRHLSLTEIDLFELARAAACPAGASMWQHDDCPVCVARQRAYERIERRGGPVHAVATLLPMDGEDGDCAATRRARDDAGPPALRATPQDEPHDAATAATEDKR